MTLEAHSQHSEEAEFQGIMLSCNDGRSRGRPGVRLGPLRDGS